MRLAACMVLVPLVCFLAAQAHAQQQASCADPDAALVVLRGGQAGTELSLDEIARHLAAGFASSNVAVCFGASPGQRRVAEVEVETESAEPDRGPVLRIRAVDALTSKTLERSVDLVSIPEDSRILLAALYIEELLQASWIETTLRDRVYLQEHPVVTPPEVRREIAAALPVAVKPAIEPRLRVSFGGAVSHFRGGLTQAGPDLFFGFTALPWLSISLRVGYRMSPTVAAPHGTIDVQALLVGAFVEAVWRFNPHLSLHFPQGVDAARVKFSAHPSPHAEATEGVRPALVVSHGVGLRIGLTALLSLSAVARFCWTLLPAEAADDERTVTGISGLGGEGGLSLDIHF